MHGVTMKFVREEIMNFQLDYPTKENFPFMNMNRQQTHKHQCRVFQCPFKWKLHFRQS